MVNNFLDVFTLLDTYNEQLAYISAVASPVTHPYLQIAPNPTPPIGLEPLLVHQTNPWHGLP